MKPEWTSELDSALREHVANGGSLTAFAKTHDFNESHASRRAKKLGLMLAFGAPKAANDAMRGSLAEAREEFARLVLADAYAIRSRLYEEEKVAVSTPAGVQEHTYDEPTAKSVAELTAAVERLARVHDNLTRIAGAKSTDLAKSAMLKLQDELRAAIDHLDPDGAGDVVDG